MSMQGALHSDHVNYLVFRYLQEGGHEETARAFFRDWHRPREYRDPEDLPFARVVRRHELVTVIQHGLRHDELQARVARSPRRFQWNQTNARHSLDGDAEVERPVDGSRPSSSGKRKGNSLGAGLRAPADFPTPASKRQRISHGPEGVHVNGDRDAMDIDTASPTAVDGEDDGGSASPAVTPEEAAEIPPERYDSVATQTEVKVGPKTSTLSFTIDKPAAKVFHSSWNPSLRSTDKGTLMTVGESLCRFYRMPETLNGDVSSIEHVDEPGLPDDCVITAMAWHPEGRTVTCAVDSFRQLPSGKETPAQMLIDIGHDIGGTVVYPSDSRLLDPSGIVLCIRYSPSGKYVLVARTNIKRGLVQVWRAASPDTEESRARSASVAWRIFEHALMDVTWVDDETFLACGEHSLASRLRLKASVDPENEPTANNLALRNVEERPIVLSSAVTRFTKVRHDDVHGFHLFFSSEIDKLFICDPGSYDVAESDNKTIALDIPIGLTALALQPSRVVKNHGTTGPDEERAVLATAHDNGSCNIHVLGRNESGPSCTTHWTSSQSTFELSDGPALALAWSPDGSYLAIAGIDLVQIWHGDTSWTSAWDSRALVTWRPSPHPPNMQNGELAAFSENLVEPSLGWSADGERLSYAVDNKVSIITFRPPLHSIDAVTNGV